MRRREFVASGAVALALGGGGFWLGRWSTRPQVAAGIPDSASGRLRLGAGAWDVLRGLEGSDALAAHALAAQQGGGDPAVEVERSLIARLELEGNLDLGAADFGQRLGDAIREDFRQRRLCVGSTWLVSQTECEAAALRWLVLGPAPAKPVAQPQSAVELREGEIAKISGWGQQETELDTPFNVQRDGHSGIWIQAEGIPPWAKFEIDGERVPVVPTNTGVSTGLYGDLQGRVLSRVGEHPVALVDEMAGLRQALGAFVVRPRVPRLVREDGTVSAVFCPIEAWGPETAAVGAPANPQPDGSEAFWVRTACAPLGVRLLFGGTELRTSVSPNLITARVPKSLTDAPGEFELVLRDSASGEIVRVGKYVLTE